MTLINKIYNKELYLINSDSYKKGDIVSNCSAAEVKIYADAKAKVKW
ncbi:hypothetical protein ACEN2I_06335 [Flavobacterium sp. W22_SRS_FK3]